MSWDPYLEEAHQHCWRSRTEIERSTRCGCFHCGAVFLPETIAEWVDDVQTAICPRCGIDSVIGDASGFDLTPEFLRRMAKHWF